ncbi:MAG: glycoside hydrolase family 28 protein [Spirochaetaceae bacterium]|nr:MAG: glycoside hydrolase family 28 protein [Spirochaetaceae bacterium]
MFSWRKGIVAITGIVVAYLFFGAQVYAQATVKFPDKIFDVTKYAVSGTVGTASIQKAIDECTAAGGGTVVVPKGKYQIGPLIMKSNVRLELKKDATLVAINDVTAFTSTPETSQYAANGWVAFINARKASNMAIVGDGVIDGQGAFWWERYKQEQIVSGGRSGTNRPRLIYFTEVANVLFDGITLKNSMSFHLVTKRSSDITINNIQIDAPVDSPNTDGIDPMSTRNVLITNCTISCGDDHIAIKADGIDNAHPNASIENIRVTGCTFLAGRGLSIGSESLGGVVNVHAENNVFRGCMYGIRIKSPRGKGGEVRQVTYINNTMTDVETCFVFSGYYTGIPDDPVEAKKILDAGGFILGNQIYPNDADPAQPYVEKRTPYFHDITITNITCTGQNTNAGFVMGLPEKFLENIIFTNVKIQSQKGMLIRNATVTNKGLVITVREGAPFILQKNGVVK